MMSKIFAPKPTIPWQPGGKANPAAPQPDPAKGPYIVEYQGSDGKAARVVADWIDSEASPNDVEVAWEKVYRWIAVADVP